MDMKGMLKPSTVQASELTFDRKSEHMGEYTVNLMGEKNSFHVMLSNPFQAQGCLISHHGAQNSASKRQYHLCSVTKQ